MKTISFNKIRIFKGPDPFARQTPSPPPADEKPKSPGRKFLKNPTVYLLLFVVLIGLLTSYIPLRSLSTIEEGEIATADIIAPVDMNFEDVETTENRKKEAEEAVLPVYVFDPNVFLNTEDKIRQLFTLGRGWLAADPRARRVEELESAAYENLAVEISRSDIQVLVKTKFPADLEETLVNILGKAFQQGIIRSKNLFILGEQERGFTLMSLGENEKTVRVSDVFDVKESKEWLAAEIARLSTSSRSRSLLTGLADAFVAPNITFNKIETEARRSRARIRIEPVYYTIKKGKVLLRKGDEATAEAIKQIRLINRHLHAKPTWLYNFLGTVMLFGLIFITLWFYLKSNLKAEEGLRNFQMMGTSLILSLITYKLAEFLANNFSGYTSLSFLSNSETYYYSFPFQMGALIFAFLTSDHIALVYTVLNSFLVGYVLNANFYMMIFSLVGGLAAIYGVKYYQRQRRTTTLRAGFFLVSPANAVIIITLHLLREKLEGLDVLGAEVFMGLLGGGLSAAIAFILLPIFENVFGFITATKLLELTNSDLPIFRQMAMEAPGSYHHSLITATLAEKAAEEIKVDPMLAKAGALYHDIGKIKRPEYFIENRTRESDVHKDLTPSMSTLVIVNHVKEGVELARKLKLPRKLRDIIEQHHGNSLVRYFYQKAIEKYDPELQKIGEEDYRYPGPRPKTKEAALVLLADSVEAASRSLMSPSRDSLRRLITDIFNSYLQDGQLDDCDFSLRELRTVASSFFTILYAVYHPRVEYPGFEFEIKKDKKPNGAKKTNGRNHQQAAKTADQS